MHAEPDDTVEIIKVDPADTRVEPCLRAYFTELGSRFAIGFDPAEALPLPKDSMRPPLGAFFLAIDGDDAVGCAGLKQSDAGFEVKRMWVADSVRGRGVGRALLGVVESRARELGASVLRLDTNGNLTEAIALYRAAGYEEIERFNDEQYADHFFEKRL